MQASNKYIEALKDIDFIQASELSLRTNFENYINEFIDEANLQKFNVLHEGKRISSFGVPDFRISFNDMMVGYIETKNITENLDKILKTEQIKKYRELSNNLIITNYLEFIWLKDDIILRETLCYLSDLENKKFKLDSQKAENVEKLFNNFFSQVPEKIALPKDLAHSLAVRCKNLKVFLYDELIRQDEQKKQDILYELYEAFRDNIFSELTISEFSDAFSQMIIFGLYLAGLNADSKFISIKNAKDFIPSNFQLIKELYKFFEVLEKSEYKATKWIIDEIISIINHIQWFDLKQNLSFNKKVKDSDNIETDAYIYFYETFLATYDYNLRKSKGVYYTPPQIVNFIVRSIDEILVDKFGLQSGLADRKQVTVLDFATGTGTFLLEVFKIILENLPKGSPEKRKLMIEDHILQNLYGFEYLIAPYTIAHLKLSQYLNENGYEFQDNDRLQVYLTNTLEPVDKQIKVPFMPQLTKETQTAQEIKDKPILVITGNPPYSGHSKNTSEWIKNEIKKYFFVDGKPLGERNPKWLQDDYVKFIRFAQDKMEKVEQGIVGIITNHSFLDNPTFRGMRQSLMNTFDQMYFIDLHGNAKKKEKTPEGKKDENIFDIQQGVCISILIKKNGLKKGIFHTDFWGKRKIKYKTCLENSLKTVDFRELKPNSPFYLFVPQNQELRKQYEEFWGLKDIFHINGVGITTAHDEFVINEGKEVLFKRFIDFKNSERSSSLLHKKFNVKKKSGWDILNGWDNLQNEKDLKKFIVPINYRIFDKRYIFYEDKLVWRTVKNLMLHFQNNNIALISNRQVSTGNFYHSFVSDYIIESSFLSNKTREISYAFPLYILKNGIEKTFFGEDVNKYQTSFDYTKIDNFKPAFQKFIKSKYKASPVDNKKITDILQFIKELEQQLKLIEKSIISLQKNNINGEIKNAYVQLKEVIKSRIEQKQKELNIINDSQNTDYDTNPDEIFYYIYAILHSPTFREKYAEFLKMDFPRIPFVDDLKMFQNISKLGKELSDAHLLKNTFQTKEYSHLGNFKGEGDKIVIKPDFRIVKTDEGIHYKLYINKTQYFETVPENVYNFYIGGYQVLDKYLKDRKNRELSHDEIDNITNIVKALTFTIKQMKLIDKETKEWI